jgi:hypothetical protein
MLEDAVVASIAVSLGPEPALFLVVARQPALFLASQFGGNKIGDRFRHAIELPRRQLSQLRVQL